jgi:YHS domain-containing protein
MQMKLSKAVLLPALLLAFFVTMTSARGAEIEPIYTGFFSDLAIDGYDTVAYFTEGKPVAGKKEFSTEYQGATWRFTSAENLAKFKADPTAYAPQYGGYCAYAVAQGQTASAEPDLWTIYQGKLYLNYSSSVNKTWKGDMESFIQQADRNWPELLGNN